MRARNLLAALALVSSLAHADYQSKPIETIIGGTGRTDITSAEYGYLAGLTGAIQAQINNGASSAALDGVSTALQIQLNGKVGVVDGSPNTVPYLNGSTLLVSSVVTPTELGYLSGASSNLQAQINAIPGASFPFVIPNSSTPNIKSDSDTGIAFPSDGLVNMINNNVTTVEFQPGQTTFNEPIIAAGGITLANTGTNLFFAGPASGSPGTAVFRNIVQGDIPGAAIPYPLQMPGNFLDIRSDNDTGLDFPSDGVIDIWANNVPTIHVQAGDVQILGGVTVTGDLNVGGNIGFSIKPERTVFAGPTSGADAAPGFRTLIGSDIPAIDVSSQATGVLSIANGGTGASDMAAFGTIPYHKSPGILGTDYDGMNYNDADHHLQLNNWQVNGNHVDESFQTASITGNISGITTAVRSDTLRVQRSFDGTFQYIQGPTNADQLNGVQSPLVIAHSTDININSASHIGFYKGEQNAPNISADSQVDIFYGRTNTPFLRGNLGEVIIEQISPNTDNTLQSITGNFRAEQVNVGGITAQHVGGIEINVNNTNVNTAPFSRPTSISANGSAFTMNSSAAPYSSSPGGPDTVNNMNTQFVVAPGSPVPAYGDIIGTAQSMSLSVSTSMPAGAAGIGISAVAYANLFGAEVGVSVPEFGGAVAALVNTFGAQGQNGGDLGTAYGFKSYGILPGGGSNVIHRGIGFWAQAGSCSGITGECYALKSDDASAKIETLSTINGASPAELGYLTGLTGNVQAQLNAGGGGGGGSFVPLAGGTMTGDLVVPSLNGISSNVLAFLEGTTGNIQEQFNTLLGVSNAISAIDLRGVAGFGSSANVITRWSTVLRNTGSDMTLTQDATNGDSITINTAGQYSFLFCYESASDDAHLGITLNQADLTQPMYLLSDNERFSTGYILNTTASDSNSICFGRMRDLSPGDVIRANADRGVGGGNSWVTQFSAIRVQGAILGATGGGGGGGADVNLSNITATSIPTDLIFDGLSPHDVGSSSVPAGNVFATTADTDAIATVAGLARISVTSSQLQDNAGVKSVNWHTRVATDGGGTDVFTWAFNNGLLASELRVKSSAFLALEGLSSAALVVDVNGHVAASTTTDTELGYVSGVTSPIQTQLNGLSAYTAGNPGDWNGSSPTTITEALDRLAACAKSGTCVGTGP